MDKPPAAFGDLQLVHAADNRSGQLMWYIKRSVLFVIDRKELPAAAPYQMVSGHRSWVAPGITALKSPTFSPDIQSTL